MTYMEKKEWETIEDDIATLEKRIAEIDSEMNENSYDSALLLKLQKERDQKTLELEAKYERWETLSEKV